ncbi:MAG TPA: monovalent cation/H+ antiporter complex subunit F [Candidatus Acidoferrum sp.]|nr:monovalent cation/H+ antiporter complex subunit F [Candidatus Acidoferrum sp.]
MNLWLGADAALLLATWICAAVILRGRRLSDCLPALQMAGVILVLALVALSQAMARPSFLDLALALAVLSFPAALLFAHFVERWLR